MSTFYEFLLLETGDRLLLESGGFLIINDFTYYPDSANASYLRFRDTRHFVDFQDTRSMVKFRDRREFIEFDDSRKRKKFRDKRKVVQQ